MNWVAGIGAVLFAYVIMPFPPNKGAALANLLCLGGVGVCAYFLWGAR